MDLQVITIGIFVIATVILTIFLVKVISKNKFYEKKYSNIFDIDKEVANAQSEKSKIEDDIEILRESYVTKKSSYDELLQKVAIYDEEIELAELGFYKPHFDFDTPENYKKELERIKTEQKKMIADKTAIYCDREWKVDGSRAKGRTMTDRGIKLTARAFNNECDSAVANVSWNNIQRMEQRIEKAFESINKLNISTEINISPAYLKLKLKEIRLTHEYKEKRQEEKEKQAEIKRQMQEETKVQQEIEQAQKEEEKYQKLLDKAKTDAEKATGAKLEKLQENIELLEKELKEAQAKNERAKSMAEQTKSGHVYVISNVGSFGEEVFKIGMTRRLEPLDRIKELGNASVPFIFDVHAMMYSEDAPALEKSLHKVFDHKRVNLVNTRKEFFNISLEEIEQEVKKVSQDIEFIRTIEAKDYRESQAIRIQREDGKFIDSGLPETI
jgi:hypothetical protein